jgi:hypothetical protein
VGRMSQGAGITGMSAGQEAVLDGAP